ncbi:hypothetical protein N7456_009827 [Penicillium angulare]|uniref:Virulence plasmid A protein n=1 Tax=Penicillium angulare TaxID=116970 RepID=A0A9W9F5H1_9EURO|nr:hypothetical protein N7456_009827 [Penicillium angulare]
MAANNVLADKEIRLLVSKVFPQMFGKSTNANDIHDTIRTQLESGKELSAALDYLRLSINLDAADDTRLAVFRYLYEVSNASVPIVAFCVLQPELDGLEKGSITKKRELAENVIQIPAASKSIPDGANSTWENLRVAFFTQYSTSVICGLLSNGVIFVPGGDRDLVIRVLRTAIERHDFDISHQPVKSIIDGQVQQTTEATKNENGKNILDSAAVPPDQQRQVLEYLMRLQRLQALVSEPEDIGALISAGYTCADEMSTSIERTLQILMEQGVPRKRAERIYYQAVNVASHRENLWTAALKLRGTGTTRDIRLAAIDGQNGNKKGSLESVLDTVSMGCDDCSSVTGLPAFFVDLLHTLSGMDISTARSLLDEVLERRPDLVKLQLSCANTNTLIPYIDLVNEVLESIIWSLYEHDKSDIPPFNMDDNDVGDSCLIQPRHVNYDVYLKLIQPMVFPLNVFPYNQAVHSVRAFLKALGSTRSQLLAQLQAPYSITTTDELRPKVQEVLEHALSAEDLGLQHEDYVAITKQGFYPYTVAAQLSDTNFTEEDYAREIGTKEATSLYWGYETPEEMISEDGLTKIREQLLPRSGLSFDELLAIIRSEYFKEQLVIEIQDPQPDHTPGELLNRMRLLEWVGEKAVPLTISTCDRFQAFLRMKNSIQWPLEDLDPVLTTLSDLAAEKSSEEIPEAVLLLDMLAATKRLSEYSKLAPTQLQPLWGPMSRHGQRSLYSQLFLKPALSVGQRQAFTPDADGQLPKGQLLSEHKRVILMGLGISDAEYLALTTMLKIPDSLTLEALSQLYRVVLFCKIANIQPSEYQQFLQLYPAGSDPFEDPRTAFYIIQQYLAIFTSPKPWALGRLSFALKGIPNTADEDCNPTTEKIVRIVRGLTAGLKESGLGNIDMNLPVKDTLGHLDAIATTLLGSQGSGKIQQFLDVPSSLEKTDFSRLLSPVLGMLDPEEENPENPENQQSSETLEDSLYDIIIKETILEERQATFLSAVIPVFRLVESSRCREAIVSSLRANYPDLETALLNFILEKIIYYDQTSGMDILLQVAQVPEPKCGSGFFQPPAADTYVIALKDGSEPSNLKVDEVQLGFDNGKTAITGPLTGGRFYKFEYEGDLADLTWYPQNAIGTPPVVFTHDVFVEDSVIILAKDVVTGLMRMSILVQTMELDVSEFEFSTVVRSEVGKFDFDGLTLKDIQDLQNYHSLRKQFTNKGAELSLLLFYKWIFSSQNPWEQLPSKLSEVSTWPLSICTHYIDIVFSKCNAEQLIDLFREVGTLYKMLESLRFIEASGLHSVPLNSLYSMARPVWKDIPKTDFEHAENLRVSMQTSNRGPGLLKAANTDIRESQRAALTAYLLSSKYAEDNELTDPDTLFEHFLIDVQMGADLNTSRMTQAVSSLQLFIHRCSLGLEKPEAQGLIKSLDIEFLLRYRLWEANRKAYLYPENWLDPTLRDNKSEQFRALESTLMQTKIDSTLVNGLIRDYISEVDKIANLQVEAYTIQEGERSDTIHVFGRTRTTPYVFYYRRATVSNISFYTPTWTPREKVDVDISIQQTDPDGNQLAKAWLLYHPRRP